MPVQMPQFSLGDMGGMNPAQYQQAQDQIGLANQFAQQGLQGGQQDLITKQLANMFNALNNPQKLQQQALQNEELTNKNTMGAIDADIASKTKEQRLSKAQQDYAMNASESELKMVGMKGQRMMLSDNPEERAKGEKIWQRSQEFIQFRMKAADELKKAEVQGINRMNVVDAQQGGMDRRNQANIDARAAAALQKSQGKAGDILSSVSAGKLNFEKAATSFEVMAAMEPDETLAQKYAEMAKKFAQANITHANAKAGTQVDLQKLGIDTNVLNMGVGGAPTRIGQVPQPQPAAPRTAVPGSASDQQSVTGPTNRAEGGMAAEIASIAPIDAAQEAAKVRRELAAGNIKRPDDRANAERWATMLEAKAKGGAAAPAGGMTRQYQGATYTLKPGADPSKKESWTKN